MEFKRSWKYKGPHRVPPARQAQRQDRAHRAEVQKTGNVAGGAVIQCPGANMGYTENQAERVPSDRADDAALAARAAGGEPRAFETIMRRHNRLLFRTARSILKNDEEAEDAVQETYLQAFHALGGFRAEARLSTWLVRIAVNQALGRLRRRSADVIPLDSAMEATEALTEIWMDKDPNGQPEFAAVRAEMRKLIEARIDKLPDAFRTVFMLRALEELTVEETAAVLDIPEETVRTRFFRARSLMREGLLRDMDMAYADAFSFAGKRCDRIVARVLAKLNEAGKIRNP
jgi:RNA polymerase sigma-70 factor, ECF subfamily